MASKFSIDPADAIAITSIHLSLLNLVKQSRETVDRQGLGEMYIKPMDELATGFSSIGLNHNWENYRRFVTPVLMNSLMFISDKLSQTSEQEERLPADDVNELILEVEELIKSVKESEFLDQRYRNLLIERLEEILQSLLNYQRGFHGNEVLEKELAQSIGLIFINYNILQNGKTSSEEGKNVYQKFMKIVSTIGKFVAGVGAKELTKEAILHLPEYINKVQDIIK